MPEKDLYERLREHLDRMPLGFPRTESGVELRILRRMFSPEEARLTLAVSAFPEPVARIRRRCRDKEGVEQKLDALAAKGLIHRMVLGGRPHYNKLPFAIGFYEGQVQRLDAALARDTEAYLHGAFAAEIHRRRPQQMRVVPIAEKIPVERGVARQDDLLEFVRRTEGPFARLACICRRAKDLVGEPCRRTKERENCLVFGAAAETCVADRGARFISREEMIELIQQAGAEGLVLQPQNIQNPLFVCTCCGCCCGVLTAAKLHPRPAAVFHTSYRAAVAEQDCAACATCEERCPMEAISLRAGAAQVNEDRCIGCGLCVSTCPSGALALKPLPAPPPPPPPGMKELYSAMYKDRYGQWGALKAVAKYMLGFKV